MIMLLIFIWIALTSGLSVSVQVGNELIPRGSIIQEGDSLVFIPSTGLSSLQSNGLACAGIEENGNFECQHMFKLQESPREKYSITVDSQKHIRVSAMPGQLQAEINSAVSISRPTPKRPQAIAAGHISEEVPVKEKSILQKYWYLIPIAFILLNAGGGKPQQ